MKTYRPREGGAREVHGKKGLSAIIFPLGNSLFDLKY
jgi:hypothetical protein